jgi:hypothetical protein
VTEGRNPIIQRSYELIHQLEKKIAVASLDANTGQEEREILVNYWKM